MKSFYLITFTFTLIVLFISFPNHSEAKPETAKVEYTDFLPRYRMHTETFLLSKIE